MAFQEGRSQGEIVPLTGLRGLAAVSVVIGHAEAEAGVTAFFRGQPAVDLFFVLSGFVISYVYLRQSHIAWRDFALARFARIYPLHIATALFMAFAGVMFARISHAAWPAHINIAQFLRELTLTMAMPLVGALKLWNFPAWSISVEWWTYFTVFPLLVLARGRVQLRSLALMFLAAALILVVCLYCTDEKATRGWLAFARAAFGFLGGSVACMAWRQWGVRMPAWANDALFAATTIAVFAAFPLSGCDAWFLIPIYPVLVYAMAANTGRAARLCSTPSMKWLGDISYSIYLIHPIALNVLEAVNAKIVPVQGRLTWVAATLVLTLVGGSLSYYLFEKPIRNLARSGRRSQAASAQAAITPRKAL